MRDSIESSYKRDIATRALLRGAYGYGFCFGVNAGARAHR